VITAPRRGSQRRVADRRSSYRTRIPAKAKRITHRGGKGDAGIQVGKEEKTRHQCHGLQRAVFTDCVVPVATGSQRRRSYKVGAFDARRRPHRHASQAVGIAQSLRQR